MKLAPRFPRPFNTPSVFRTVLPDLVPGPPILSGCPTPTDRGAAISDHPDGSDGSDGIYSSPIGEDLFQTIQTIQTVFLPTPAPMAFATISA